MSIYQKISFDVIEKWLQDDDRCVREAAMNACEGRDVPLEVIEKGLRDDDRYVRAAAMNACEGRDVPLEVIEKWLRDDNCYVRAAAMRACEGRDVPLEVIEKWLQDDDRCVREAAMNACEGRDVPLEVIEKGLQDSDWRVRVAAMKACEGRDVPLIRTFEPPERVYKKCLCGVIVEASIPKDAQVRGDYYRKCRANKAIITNIFGSVRNEPIGISRYDLKTFYHVGDIIEIDNFDYSNEECSTGFHFFCTLEEALKY